MISQRREGRLDFSEYLLANLAAWREIYITQKISARKKSRKGVKGAKIHSEYFLANLAAWREIYITQNNICEKELSQRREGR